MIQEGLTHRCLFRIFSFSSDGVRLHGRALVAKKYPTMLLISAQQIERQYRFSVLQGPPHHNKGFIHTKFENYSRTILTILHDACSHLSARRTTQRRQPHQTRGSKAQCFSLISIWVPSLYTPPSELMNSPESMASSTCQHNRYLLAFFSCFFFFFSSSLMLVIGPARFPFSLAIFPCSVAFNLFGSAP